MKYRLLGPTGVKVSALCLGTMTFGEKFFNIAEVDQTGADAMVGRVLDAGVNFSIPPMFIHTEKQKQFWARH